MSNYIGIDPGTNCGWAILDANGKRIASGTWDLRPRRHEGGGMRYLKLRRFLEDLLATPAGIRAVGYEEVRRHAGTDAAHVYGGIVATIASVCEERGVAYVGIPVATAKRAATGRGNADKEAMIAAARATFGAPADERDDDEADALWVGVALMAEVGGL